MFEKLEKLQIVTLSIVLAAGLICSAKVLSGTFSNDQITVTGSASEIVKSDSGRLQFEITARQPNKAAAYALIQKQMPVVMQYLEAKGVAKAYGDKLLFDNLNFMLPPNGIVGVIGPNGAGKTTLFRLILGLETVDKGTFEVGETVKLAYVDQ